MSVAAERMPDWKDWQGEVADGRFPLERFLGRGANGAVFLTRTASGEAATIKLIPASPEQAGNLVDRWRRAAGLDHPHLMQIFASGTWRRAGTLLAYVVSEYAEENLATVLDERPLESGEVLPAIADTLVFLHARGYALGGLKPSNVFAVGDTLKLSSDTVAPGDKSADVGAVGDLVVRTLGAPAPLPEPFDEIARGCLGNGRPSWSAPELAKRLRPQKEASAEASKPEPPRVQSETAKPKLTSYAIGFGVLLITVITVGSLLKNRPAAPPAPVAPRASSAPVEAPAPETKPQPSIAETKPQPAIVEKKPERPAAAPVRESPRAHTASVSPAQVVHEVLPDIPAKARRTIRGKATVVVKVAVDSSGEVTEATPERGGSRYFARLAAEAARQWRFAPGDSGDYLLRFQMTREDIKTTLEKSR